MKILLEIRAAASPGARPSVSRRTIVGDWIRVGRDAACEIHLPDPRIPLAQGLIVDRSGLLYIEGEGGSHDITRKSVRSVRLKPGSPIEVGPYRMEAFAAPEGYDGAIRFELVRPLQAGDDLAARSSRTTLASVGVSKRATAWVIGIAVVALAFAIPAGRVLHLPWKSASETALGDRVWNPGPLILAHQPIEQRCAACHEIAFHRVRDGACIECHRDIGDHVPAGAATVALFDGKRCAGCHLEHKGSRATMRDDDGDCVVCHASLHSRVPGTATREVSDFANAHPPFRLSIPDGKRIVRVRQESGGAILRTTALRFPHDKHLDPKGVRSPDKGRVTLHCDACHHPDASGRAFEPISMTRDCRQCHRLQFEPAVTTREVPHGKPADAAQVIEEFYANLALKGTPDSFRKAFGVPGEGLLRRVGEPSDAEREGALHLASSKARKVSHDLFEVRVCKTCHAVEAETHGASTEWSVAPVQTVKRWMPHARFDHRAHAASRCEDCHRIALSKDVREVVMPTIDDCRKCHGGSRPIARKVTSNCLLCHGFHEVPHAVPARSMPRVADAH